MFDLNEIIQVLRDCERHLIKNHSQSDNRRETKSNQVKRVRQHKFQCPSKSEEEVDETNLLNMLVCPFLNWNQMSVSRQNKYCNNNNKIKLHSLFEADSTIDAHCVECVCYGCQSKCKHYDLRR